ncbi:MAG: PAS domain S-box protein [Desulfobulbus sp.]|nr:PAS domain S-box protein [Desulfobulbus sp.]
MNDSGTRNSRDITQLYQRIAALEAAEADLKSECESLRQFYVQSPLAYQSLGTDGTVLEVNQRWLDTLGYTREEVLGKKFSEFLHSDFRDYFHANFSRFKDAGEIYGVEFTMVKKDGSLIQVSFDGKISTNPDGTFQRTHCFFQDITQRKRDEAALCESEERFRTLHNASFGGITIHDQGIILDCNQGLAEQTGYTVDELIGMDGLLLIAPQCRDQVRRNIQRKFDQPYESIGRRKDGSQYPARLRGSNIPYKGRLVRVTEFRDISEFKRLEEALEKRLVALTCPLTKENGVTFEDLFDLARIQQIQDEFANATGLASLITRPDGTPITEPSNFTRLCSAIIRTTEIGCANCFKSDAALGQHHPEGPIIQPCLSGGLWDAGASITVGGHHLANWLIGQVRNEVQDEEAMRRYAREIGADEEDFIQAFQEVPSMSRERFESVAQALFTLANQLSFSAYQNVQQARAITERKQVEAALRVSEERFRLAMEATKDGLWDWDIGLGTVYYSPSYWAMLGYDAGEQPQEAIAWMERLHPEDRESVLAVNTDCIENRCESFLVEYRMQTKDGTWKWVQGRGKAIARGENGHALRMVGTHIDITERKQTEQEREKLEAQLLQSQKMESVARLAGGIAHDFNNMLMVVQGHAELAMLDMEQGNPYYHRFRAIREIVDRSADLTRQLLAFARKQPIAPKLLDLSTCIENMLSMLRRLIGEDITLTWLPDSELWSVKADPSQIDQILANLCVNARDAIAGVGTIIVETQNCTFDASYCAVHTGCVPGDYVQITVGDNGCGMDKETLAQVFEPFFTTKGVGKGTGLGLATVYGIVRQNNGFVNVYSEPGQGTVFTVYIPREADSADEVLEERTVEAIGGSETILVVEDEPTILEMATAMLQHLGYTVFASTSPYEALDKCNLYSGKIDLLITDVIMPEMNGRDLAEQIQKEHPWIKCLFMSGYTADIIAHQGVLEEGIHFIQKPFSHISLAAKVRSVLDGE